MDVATAEGMYSSTTYWSATRPHNLQALPIDERVFFAGVVRVISLNAVGSKMVGRALGRVARVVPDDAMAMTCGLASASAFSITVGIPTLLVVHCTVRYK